MVPISVFAESTPVSVRFADGKQVPIQVPFTDANRLHMAVTTVTKVTLAWEDNVALDLHVVGPGGTFGGKGDTTPGALGATAGVIDLASDGTNEGWHLENYRALPTDPKGSYLVFVSAGRRQPAPDDCARWAGKSVSLKLIVLQKGMIQQTPYAISFPGCGQGTSHRIQSIGIK